MHSCYLAAQKLPVPNTAAHATSLPAADELDESPVKKLPLAAEPALPKSVAAPVLDADWANADCNGIANADASAAAMATTDMTASNVMVLIVTHVTN
jgi:hypothetical protein